MRQNPCCVTEEWFQSVPTNSTLEPNYKVGFLHVNEELFQWVPSIWTLEPNLKVDFFHVSKEWSQWAPTRWKLEQILMVKFFHMNEELFHKILMEFAQIWRPSIRIIWGKLSGYQIPHFRPDNPDFRYQILSVSPSLMSTHLQQIMRQIRGQWPYRTSQVLISPSVSAHSKESTA